MLFYLQMCLLKEYMFFFVRELKSHCDAYEKGWDIFKPRCVNIGHFWVKIDPMLGCFYPTSVLQRNDLTLGHFEPSICSVQCLPIMG